MPDCSSIYRFDFDLRKLIITQMEHNFSIRHLLLPIAIVRHPVDNITKLSAIVRVPVVATRNCNLYKRIRLVNRFRTQALKRGKTFLYFHLHIVL